MGISPLLAYSLSKPQLFLQKNSAYIKQKRQIVSHYQDNVKRGEKKVFCHSYCREGNYFVSLQSLPPRAEQKGGELRVEVKIMGEGSWLPSRETVGDAIALQ